MQILNRLVYLQVYLPLLVGGQLERLGFHGLLDGLMLSS
jgi:hypothetical protein